MSNAGLAQTRDNDSLYLDKEEVQYVLGYVVYRHQFIIEYQVLIDFTV